MTFSDWIFSQINFDFTSLIPRCFQEKRKMWAQIFWAHLQTIFRIPALFWMDISGRFPGLFLKRLVAQNIFKTFFSPIQCYIELYRERLRNATVPLPIGKMIPKNFQVLNIKTAKLENLQKYLGKLTVLNFGSCTWPPFMKSILEFEKIVEKFSSGFEIAFLFKITQF